ncbi:hypothetical protein M501DRAFT_916343, partial [Patellaria atrata CBS 101060]
KQPSLANIAVQSFAAFRAQTSSLPAPSPVRRKPLPLNASPVATRFSSAEVSPTPKTDDRSSVKRSYSIDSPPLPGQARVVTVLSPPLSGTEQVFVPRDLDRHPHGSTPLVDKTIIQTPSIRPLPIRTQSDNSQKEVGRLQRPKHDRAASSYHTAKGSISDDSEKAHSRSHTMDSHDSMTKAPHLTLELDGVTETFIEEGQYSPDSQQASKPKSPSRFTSFFGWKSSSQQSAAGTESPTTTFSEKSSSPGPSPMFSRSQGDGMGSRSGPAALDIPKANAMAQTSYFNVPGTPLLSNSPAMNAHVEALEEELRQVSQEYASSIRREMDLEDQIERYKSDYPQLGSTQEGGKRTSDYYSDSGMGSTRGFPLNDSDTKMDELERIRRDLQREKGQLKVQLANTVQKELRHRRDLEAQIQTLEEQMQERDKQMKDTVGGGDRVRELEATLDDLRRRLQEERQYKESFEDLLSALRQELEQHRNERDNLRDEVVPQLRARVEGLESEAAEVQSLTYDNTRMQQEIQSLRNEYQNLQAAKRFNSIAEEDDLPSPISPRVGLSRSNSLARHSVSNLKRGSLSRSSSVKEKPEGKELHLDRLKEVEDQRDALHRALKSLLERQEFQAKEHAKRIRLLEMERDRALTLTPRRTAFSKEVKHLKSEINHLRKRADEALEQKWQCEKGLGGLKMDLDRAQQETSSLRDLLQERDIFIPERKGSGAGLPEDKLSISVSLDKAYKELQTTHALSLARIRDIEDEDTLGSSNASAERTMELLRKSISDAEAERDVAVKETELYRQQARALQRSEVEHLGKEQSLAAELVASATRMDQLSTQVELQLEANKALKKRLAEAIGRGEKEQQASAARIVELQSKLKGLEDKVMAAQQHSEEMVNAHEEEITQLKETHNTQLQRVKSGLLSPAKYSPTMPLSPLFAARSPRLDKTTSGPGISMAEATKTEFLETRVEELEKALAEADREMEEVVGRMNMAQIEVAELQSDRDEAMRQTRRLKNQIQEEREKVKALMA